MSETEITTWDGCYRDGWKSLIGEASFSHPAKFSRGLIRRIYEHAMDEGWLHAGDVVCDPFGGIALGAFDAAMNGAYWIGCELEAKFVALGNENIELWKHRYGHRPGYGSARLIQGDSRKLSEVLREAGLCVSSPPFAGITATQDPNFLTTGEQGKRNPSKSNDANYGSTPGNLGNLPATEAGLTIAISSPPFSPDQPCASQTQAKKDYQAFTRGDGTKRDHEMRSEGNLSAMKEGDFSLVVSSPPYEHDTEPHGDLRPEDGRKTKHEEMRGYGLVVSSPPYADSVNSGESGIDWDKAKRPERWTGNRKRNGCQAAASHEMKYGDSSAQLGAMPDKGFDLSVSSPPWEDGAEGTLRGQKFRDPVAFAAEMASRDGKNGRHAASPQARRAQMERDKERTYGDSEGQLGKDSGQDFWSAAKQIVEETYKVLAPGAHAIWVVKGFVRKKTYVDFPDQWRQLCEAVGFVTLHWHNASLVEHSGTQHTLDGGEDKIEVQHKSFFRRLAESKGSPAINAEVVLCMLKPTGAL